MNDPISYLFSLENRGIKLGLERTKSLLKSCNNPHEKLKCIQIAGTNGKGSVSSMISNGLHSLGYNVGLYTSPHLIHLNERIRINGNQIKNDELTQIIKKNKNNIQKNNSSFFEAMTMIAFIYFKKKKVDFSILETGLGGRLDSVTTCFPQLTIFTPISMDHKEILGDTIEKIAYEKAGIIKNNVPVFSSKQNKKVKNILENQAKKKKTKIFYCQYKNIFKLKYLKGKHQEENAQLALDIISNLVPIEQQKIIYGIENTKWYGRYQILKKNPYIIFDVGHNEDGINVFLNEYKKEKIKGKKYLIIVLQNRKSITKIEKKINCIFDEIICSQTLSKFSMKAENLYNSIKSNKTKIIINIEKAIQNINNKLKLNDSLVIMGSHYLGESIKRVYKNSFDKL